MVGTVKFPESARKNIAYQIRGTFRAFENTLIKFLKDKNISVAYFHVLRLPWDDNGFSRKDISKLAFITPSVTSQLIKKMTKDGILSDIKVSNEKKARKVALTTKGHSFRASIIDGSLALADNASDNLSDDEVENLIKMLTNIRSKLEAEH
jgi:DNA-binding MarR family transcriptional regulator